jgi:hypothetical protein
MKRSRNERLLGALLYVLRKKKNCFFGSSEPFKGLLSAVLVNISILNKKAW